MSLHLQDISEQAHAAIVDAAVEIIDFEECFVDIHDSKSHDRTDNEYQIIGNEDFLLIEALGLLSDMPALERFDPWDQQGEPGLNDDRFALLVPDDFSEAELTALFSFLYEFEGFESGACNTHECHNEADQTFVKNRLHAGFSLGERGWQAKHLCLRPYQHGTIPRRAIATNLCPQVIERSVCYCDLFL